MEAYEIEQWSVLPFKIRTDGVWLCCQQYRTWNREIPRNLINPSGRLKLPKGRPRAEHDWLCRRLHGGSSQKTGTRQEGGPKET